MTALPSRASTRRAARLRRMPKLADDQRLDALLQELADASAGNAFPRMNHEAIQSLGRVLYRHFQPREEA